MCFHVEVTGVNSGLISQGFLDIDLTEFKKSGANVTGFQLMNYSDPDVSRTIQEWLEFDSKDIKAPKKRLKVKPGPYSAPGILT